MPILAPLLVLAAVAPGCITSRCFRDGDCAAGQVCDPVGICVEACHSDGECDPGLVCREYVCIPGCRGSSECASPQECVAGRCVTIGDECGCPMAPAFCGTDLNPRSPTSGQELCVPGSFPGGVGIFFGSARCSHCLADFAELRRRAAELVGEGLAPRLLWAQLATVVVAPSDLEYLLGPDVANPLVQDTGDLAIWERYDCGWYDFVLVDVHGCLTDRFTGLSAGGIAGETGERIKAAWRLAMDDACPLPAGGD